MEFLPPFTLSLSSKLKIPTSFLFSRNNHFHVNAFLPPAGADNKPSHTQFSLSNRAADIKFKPWNFFLSGSLALALSLTGIDNAVAKVGVNKPELLPSQFTPVIDVAGFLSDGQEKRLAEEIASIEREAGFKLRVLAQNYPDTPGKTIDLCFGFGLVHLLLLQMIIIKLFWKISGLAIKDFWKVDDQTIVFVADPTFGNILNFNVGATVDLDIPRSFWSRLAGKYGNMFYWKEKGEDASIEAAVMAISNCLKEPVGSNNCAEVK